MIDHSALPSTVTSRLPERYLQARQALRLCARTFTPENYIVAMIALRRCWHADECAAWPAKEALAAYGRMAGDSELMRLAARIAVKHREWKASPEGGSKV